MTNLNEKKQVIPETLTDIQQAARYLYLQRLCYGGRMNNRTFGTHTQGTSHFNVLDMQSDLEAAWRRLSGVQIENLDFRDLIPRYDREYTFFYLDPPYQGMPYYRYNFTRQDFEDLSAILAGIKGKFLMSINDTPEIREIFGTFIIDEVKIVYSIHRDSDTTPTEPQTELLISNYAPEKRQQTLFE